MADKYYLARFKNAQMNGINGSGSGTYSQALSEIKEGKKRSHWMWYVFPQVVGFGHSHNTKFYSIKSKDEATAYLNDPDLGSRLREISEALLQLETSNPYEVFGEPDWRKLGSCMTLFDYISPDDVFDKVLKKFYSGAKDLRSLSIIRNLEKTKNE